MTKATITKLKVYAVFLVLMAILPFVAKAGSSLEAPDESFFIHLHDQRAMANVTISAVHDGAVEIAIQLETVEELPLKAESVSVTLGNPDKGIASITTQALRTADDHWSVKMAASGAGRWNLGLGITLAPANTISIVSPILIY
jgi:periplasmic copper chaperone A